MPLLVDEAEHVAGRLEAARDRDPGAGQRHAVDVVQRDRRIDRHRPPGIGVESHGIPGVDGRCIVGAMDDDVDLPRGAVHRMHGEVFGHSVPGLQRLHGGVVVVEGVGPGAAGGDGEAAINGAGRNRLEQVGGVVDVGGGQHAGDDRRAGRGVAGAAGFHHDARDVARDHRGVVGAVDGDGDLPRGAVRRMHREGFRQRVPGIERLHRGVPSSSAKVQRPAVEIEKLP